MTRRRTAVVLAAIAVVGLAPPALADGSAPAPAQVPTVQLPAAGSSEWLCISKPDGRPYCITVKLPFTLPIAQR